MAFTAGISNGLSSDGSNGRNLPVGQLRYLIVKDSEAFGTEKDKPLSSSSSISSCMDLCFASDAGPGLLDGLAGTGSVDFMDDQGDVVGGQEGWKRLAPVPATEKEKGTLVWAC